MSRKHFQALADEIARIEDIACRIQAANAVARACRAMNPNFDNSRFMRACGV